MQPKMCSKSKKNIAVVFITKVENGVTMNEGYCLKCARSLGIPQIDQAVKQMGISDEDLDMLSDEMSSMFGQKDAIKAQWTTCFPDSEKALHCVRCGKCEAVCPQKLPIRDSLAQLQKELDAL